jgi:hypothetical protein
MHLLAALPEMDSGGAFRTSSSQPAGQGPASKLYDAV